MILWSQVFRRQNTQGTHLRLQIFFPQALQAPFYQPQKEADLGSSPFSPQADLGHEGLVPGRGHRCQAVWARANGSQERGGLKSNTCPSDPENLVTPQDQSPRFRRATPTLAPRKWNFDSHICTNSPPPHTHTHSCSRPEN